MFLVSQSFRRARALNSFDLHPNILRTLSASGFEITEDLGDLDAAKLTAGKHFHTLINKSMTDTDIANMTHSSILIRDLQGVCLYLLPLSLLRSIYSVFSSGRHTKR